MRELASGGTEVNIPDEFALTHAYPNPFNSTVTIGYALNEDLDVKLSIFDPTGRLVAILNEGKMKAGYHNITWNANDATSGVYLCRLESEKQHRTIKLTLIK
ncbi:T9SS type A sorting domain-containing protein [bacterium]|nr:T9SS type A sorting domain-containing protein [bacterium]